jgi:hypothetical protein
MHAYKCESQYLHMYVPVKAILHHMQNHLHIILAYVCTHITREKRFSLFIAYLKRMHNRTTRLYVRARRHTHICTDALLAFILFDYGASPGECIACFPYDPFCTTSHNSIL